MKSCPTTLNGSSKLFNSPKNHHKKERAYFCFFKIELKNAHFSSTEEKLTCAAT